MNTQTFCLRALLVVVAALVLVSASNAASNLRLNPHLDYTSDSRDGPLITADSLGAGPVPGKPTCVLITSQTCFNSKRQARRTVELYRKYAGRVQFVLVDLDAKRSPPQERLVKEHYTGYIPHVTLLGRDGRALYDGAGEVGEAELSRLLDKALR